MSESSLTREHKQRLYYFYVRLSIRTGLDTGRYRDTWIHAYGDVFTYLSQKAQNLVPTVYLDGYADKLA